jgi:hypothetical protein
MKNVIYLIIILSIFSFSCNETVISGPPITSTNDFPNSQGSYWEYLVTDSLDNSTDTLRIIISGETTISTGEAVTIWQMNYPGRTDSNYVLFNRDTVKIFEDKEYLIENIKIVFPLRTGTGWRGDFITDTSYVSRVTDLSLPAGNFNPVFVIEREYGGFNEYRNMTIWFAAGIGIIKLNKREVGFEHSNESWELLSFEIK